MTTARLVPDDARAAAPADRSAVPPAQRALAELLGPAAERSYDVRYWDGTVERAGTGDAPRFTLVINAPGALRRMFLPPSELALGEAFVRGDVDVEGDLESATALGERLRTRIRARRWLRALPHLLALPHHDAVSRSRQRRAQVRGLGHRHTPQRDAAAIRSHYDVGNDFYALWLDDAMVYSCAYFPTGSEDIDAAQAAKLDLICRKLRLQPGERLLDIGCGWGGLIRHAAAHYGVRALGITLSRRQAELATERIRAAGLADRCAVEIRDYRAFPPETVFDKVVSVGMFEHVGRSQLGRYFAEAFRLTKPGGLFLNHGIVRTRERVGAGFERVAAWVRRRMWREGQFIDRYVFPDGELVPLDVELIEAARAGFEARDVESLREHYAMTLRHWVGRLERGRAAAVAAAGERAYRIWRLYMAASARAFTVNRIALAQVLLARPDEQGRVMIPPTRADLYLPAPAPAVARGAVA